MNSYTDTKIIECNRLHSEEAQADPLRTENNSIWTNNLQDIVHLNPGDEVSVYGSFISERGAGQQSSIEIKGHDLGSTQTFDHIKLNGSGTYDDYSIGFKEIEAEYKVDTFNLRDDTGRFTISYYIPANGHNSVQIPRRWMYADPAPRLNWTLADSRSTQGMSLWYPEAGGFYLPTNFYATYKNVDVETPLKQKLDNSRYTIMVRNNTYFDPVNASGKLEGVDKRDPEYDDGQTSSATYRVYKELKEVVVPAGFNSAEFVATEITRQIQNIEENKIFTHSTTQNAGKHPINVLKTIASETYKPIMAGNVVDNQEHNFLYYFNLTSPTDRTERAGWTNGSGAEWLRQYQYVGCKYPELFETGRLCNRDYASIYRGSRGTTIRETVLQAVDAPWVLEIPYTKGNVDDYRDFFKAQKLYPEIIEALNDSRSGYNPGNDLTNTRFLHINRYKNASQSYNIIDDAQLGWGGYYYPRSWEPTKIQQLASLLICLFFDPVQEDIFYARPDEKLEQYSYGCIGRTDDGYMKIYPNKHINNGFNTFLYLECFANTGGEIEVNRRLGFDMHFTAPGMSYLLELITQL